jgi:hypothetical protein
MVRAWLLLRPDLDEQYLTASYRVYLNEADAKKGISTGDFSGRPVSGSAGVVCSWFLLFTAIIAAVRQKFHLSSCPNFRDRLLEPS